MLTKELIRQLQQFDPDSIVTVFAGNGNRERGYIGEECDIDDVEYQDNEDPQINITCNHLPDKNYMG